MKSKESENLRKQALEANSLLASIVESSDNAVVGKTLDGTILSWNSGAQKIYGYTADEVKGRSISILVPPDKTDEVPQLLQRIRKGERIEHYETVRMRKDGKQINISLTMSPIKDSTGKIIGASTIARDITEHRRAEEELQRAHDELEIRVKERTAELEEANIELEAEIAERKRAEEASRQSEGRLRLLSDLTMEGIVIHDKGIILDANEALARMFGYGNVSEVIGKSGFDLMTPESQQLLQRHIATGSDEPYEAVGIKKDGMRFPIEIHGSNIKYKGKTVRTGVVRDLTERKRAEEALRENEERLRLAVEAGNFGTWELDLVTGQAIRSLRHDQIFGYAELQPEWSLEKGLQHILPEDRQKVQDAHTPAPGKTNMYIEARFRRVNDGAIRWLMSYGRFYYDDQGRPIRIVGIFADITERKWAEEALRESEQRWATTLASIGDAVISTDTEGRITFMNAEAEALTGWMLSEASTKPVTEVFNIINEYTRQEADNPVTRVLQEGTIVDLANHTILIKRDGTEVPIDDSGAPIRDEDGKTMGMVLVFRDITERKHAEEAVSRSQKTFSELVERAPFGIYIVDSRFRIAQMNAGSQAGAFRNVRPVIGRDFAEAMRILWPEPVAAEIIANFRHTLDTGEPYYSPRFTNPRHDVETDESYEWELHRMTLPDGQYGVICYYFDSTKLREAEEALRKSEAMLAGAEKIANAGSWDWDIGNGKLIWSEQTYRIFGMEMGKLIPTYDSFLAHIHPEDRQRVERAIDDAVSGTKPFDLEYRIIKLDSSERWVQARGEVVFNDSARPIRMIGSIVDITERKRAEEALRESDQRYSSLFANQSNGMAHCRVITDEQGKPVDHVILAVNEAYERIVGIKKADVEGRLATELFPDIRNYALDFIGIYGRIALEGGETRFEQDLKPTNRYLSTYVYCPKHGEFTVIFTDITDRKRAEEALRKAHDELELRVQERTADLANVNEKLEVEIAERRRAEEAIKTERQRLYNVLETMPAMICLLTPDYHVAFANRSFRERFGESHGRHCYDYCFGRTGPCGFCESYRVLETGRSHRWEVTGPDGSVIDAYDFPFTDVDGSPMILEMDIDITERKKAEEKIQEQATLLDNAQEAIGVRSLEHRLIYWNKGAQRLYGWTKEEAIGKNPVEFLFKDKEEPPQLIEAKRSVLEKGEWTGELHQVTKDGREVTVESHWTLIYNNEGKPKSILVVNTDITEKKMFESHLLRAQRMESIGILAGGIAHNLNNMLTPITLSIQMLKQKYKDEQSQKLLTILEQNSQRSADLIKQVLSFSRGVEGERNSLHVANIVFEVEKIAKETFPRNIEIRTDMPIGVWTISGDATQLHQVIMNLCVNARDVMPDGGILSISAENFFIDETYVRMHTEAKVGSYVAIAVSDTGIGIPPKIVDRIFEPFFTTKEFGKGTGLGLSTALAIVKSHGGFINVYSEVGKGTTFRVYLPAIKTEMQNVEKQKLELLVGNGELVLVAEDEDSVREVTISILKEYGYNVLAGNDGADAVALYAQNKDKIKVVLMDMMMPVMDGEASIRAIRRINPEVKVIVVSGLAEKDKVAKIESTHAQALLPKPYTAERLLKAMYEVLSSL